MSLSIIDRLLGIFRSMDGELYKKDLSASDDLREFEENERDEIKALVQLILLKRV